jgi:hypothetical protein
MGPQLDHHPRSPLSSPPGGPSSRAQYPGVPSSCSSRPSTQESPAPGAPTLAGALALCLAVPQWCHYWQCHLQSVAVAVSGTALRPHWQSVAVPLHCATASGSVALRWQCPWRWQCQCGGATGSHRTATESLPRRGVSDSDSGLGVAGRRTDSDSFNFKLKFNLSCQ